MQHLGALFLGKVKYGKITFKIDTGAEVTVIGTKHLKKFGIKIEHLFTTNKQLIGRPAIQKFNLVKVVIPERFMCAMISKSKSNIVEQFPSVLKGLGTIKGDPVHITQENTTPYHIGAPRRVAFPLLEPLKLVLERLKEMGVIKIVDQPTDWCHPIVIVKKPNRLLCICIDLTQLNKDTKREFYELPSVDDSLAQLGNRCKYMAILDANSGYWQLPMDIESQLKCTFTTPFGQFCPTRGPFGLTSLPEIFSKKIG
ncbi:uncharacterized protein LOC136089896 [Hydra vulgaris]|uniref:Uncharacterized protein LOC136089896 n=1 Tax=Hydra vulgaris TaxID=6087 RepID=A0ABM4DCF9_HYDVU